MQKELETKLTDAVIARLSDDADPRFRRIMQSVIRHLHDFVREVELTEEEWFEAIKFLTATGQKCDDKRQEFILMSDVLGVSMLVTTLLIELRAVKAPGAGRPASLRAQAPILATVILLVFVLALTAMMTIPPFLEAIR